MASSNDSPTGDDVKPRIVVTNLDAVSQADLWLTQGPAAAIESLTAIVRTALLLGGELVVDRNQVLDGIFFLAVGPDGIRHELGLPPGSDLPITITCHPAAAAGPARFGSVPRLAGRAAPLEGSGADISLDAQLEQVHTDAFLTASSAWAATMGTLPLRGWLYPPVTAPDWFPGAGFLDVLHQARTPAAVTRLLHAAQERWMTCATVGQVAVDTWTGAIDMAPALASQEAALAEACGKDLEPAPLAAFVLDQETTVRKEMLSALEARREAHPETTDDEMRLASTLWSKAYYQAIAWREDALLLTFNTGDSASAQDARLDTLRRFGLALPTRSWLRSWLDRRAGTPQGRRPMLVEGEILDHMRVIDPGAFRQLSRTVRPVVSSLVERRDPHDMYDLALACREAVHTPPSHRQTRTVTVIRIVTITTLAVLIAGLSVVGDALELSVSQRWMVVVGSAILGVLASLPYDDIAEQFRLRPASMTAMLNLRADR